ncbi:MAG: class I SAM-dependent methyltransferase [Rhodobacteraceae bacterium]|nr:class I SAM-dependent methyltransferase [Paracoccaceae bacterium]
MWDERYSEPGFLFGTAPAQFLAEQAEYLQRGLTALAVADGEGRNSVYMAERGMRVTAMDASEVGLAKAKGLAAARSAPVNFVQADLRTWDWQPEAFDLVAAIFIQFADPGFRAEIFAGMTRTLKPGGILLLHGYTPEQVAFGTGGPPNPDYMYTTDMLTEAFGDMDILRLAAYEREVDEGRGHKGRSALIDLVARKRPDAKAV